MNAYEKARELIQQIERHRGEVNNHQKMISQLEIDLRSALTDADLKLKDGPAVVPPQVKTQATVAPVTVVSPANKKAVVPSKSVPVRSKKAPAAPPAKQRRRSRPSSNGQKGPGQEEKPTLGDLVRAVLLKADRPLRRSEIQTGLEELNYSNSAPNPYKTLGVRLHRLEGRGVKSLGNGLFEVSAQWKRKLEREAQAAAKKQAREEAKAAAATVAASAAPETDVTAVAS